MAAKADRSKPYIPTSGLTEDGWSNEKEASATCFCGTVQLALPTEGPGLVDIFLCNCSDCRKLTVSMFASNIIVSDKYLRHVRGQDNLKTFAQKKSVRAGTMMTNYFCQTCGSLMYRVAERFPGHSILRLGTVDDFNLAETKLRPRTEQFIADRVSWFTGCEGAKQFEGNAYGNDDEQGKQEKL
ncbi:Mss4-like protein [Xylariaceae sp. FL0255]|nr:Mss4-like protein [Xylariaceae sp. FL0255]